jgi:hypothetical protein
VLGASCAEIAARAAGMPESLRTEIKQLLAHIHYCDASGADLRTAAIVIGAMATKK